MKLSQANEILRKSSATLVTLLALSFVELASAQVDSSSSAFLGSGSSRSPIESGLDSGRYKVNDRKHQRDIAPREFREIQTRERPDPKNTTSSESNSNLQKAPTSDLKERENPSDPQKPSPVADLKTTKNQKASGLKSNHKLDPKIGDPMAPSSSSHQVLNPTVVCVQACPAVSHASETADEASYELDPSLDWSLPLLELEVSMLYQYQHFESNSWARSFEVDSPAFRASPKLWLTPEWGFSFSFAKTIAATISDSLDRSRQVAIESQWLAFDFRYRHTIKRKNKLILEYGIGFFDSQVTPDTESKTRIGLRSNGFQLSIDIQAEENKNRKLLLSAVLRPLVQQNERNIGGKYLSGEFDQGSAFQLGAGESFRLNDEFSLFYKLTVLFEKARYRGQSESADLAKGVQLNGVSASNTSTFVEIGLKWGK